MIFKCRSAAMSGDGKAGAINEEGGAFGKLEVAREAEYFYKKVSVCIEVKNRRLMILRLLATWTTIRTQTQGWCYNWRAP